MVPGLGDEVQHLKAGIVEIGDVICVNKADRPGANEQIAQLRSLMNLTHGRRTTWRPPIVPTVAMDGTGVEDLIDAIDSHATQSAADGTRAQREHARARLEVMSIVVSHIVTQADLDLAASPMVATIDAVVARQTSPRSVADTLLARWKAK